MTMMMMMMTMKMMIISGRKKAGWIDSTNEFKQYKESSLNRKEKEENKEVTEIERKLAGINEYKEEQGIEVQHFYSSTIDVAINGHTEAEGKNLKAAEILAIATEVLDKCKKEYDHSRNQLGQAQARREKARKEADQANQDAESKTTSAKTTTKEMKSLKELIEDYTNKQATASTVSATAAQEAQISEERANDAEKRAKRAHAAAQAAAAEAESETKKEVEAQKTVTTENKVYNEVNKNYKVSKQKWQVIAEGVEKVKQQIRNIQGNSQYLSEKSQAEKGNLDDGKMLKKHRLRVEEQLGLEDKLHKAARDKRIAEERRDKAQKYLDDAVKHLSEQRMRAAKAQEEADDAATLADELAGHAEEEKEAAKMRKDACDKAESSLQKIEAQLTSSLTELKSAEITTEEMVSSAMMSQAQAKKSKRYASNVDDLEKYVQRVERKRKQLRSAEKAFSKASDAHEWTGQKLDEARNALNDNADLYYKAKIDASKQESRANAEQTLTDNTIVAYQRYKGLMKEADKCREEAGNSRAKAAEKAAAYRKAQDYTEKKALIHHVPKALTKMTLLHSVRFRYFDDSMTLPFNHMHNISEGKLHLIYNQGKYEMASLKNFTKNHLTRVFPSKHQVMRSHSNNYNPVLAWSLGCQIASINQQVCDAFILVNDGRFRVNGSCGYVLKPEAMIERKGGDISRRNKADMFLPSRWNVKILSGHNLPKPRKKALVGTINARVRVTLYDGGSNAAPTVHVTDTLTKNGLNPIWDETEGSTFHVKDPSTAILLFSLWDWDDEVQDEDFIAAAAVPISCMRQGYRSVPMFDANHMRCGSHAFTTLLVRIDAKNK